MMTPIELNRRGFQSLVNNLGFVDAVRFIPQFDDGSEDYTRERYQWLDRLSQEDISADIDRRQQANIEEK